MTPLGVGELCHPRIFEYFFVCFQLSNCELFGRYFQCSDREERSCCSLPSMDASRLCGVLYFTCREDGAGLEVDGGFSFEKHKRSAGLPMTNEALLL